MKDALGHGSDGKNGAHSSGVNKVGSIKLHPQAITTARNALLHSGGFSVKPDTGSTPKSGYMVSIPGHEEVVHGDVDEAHLARYANSHADALSAPGAHIGGWQHEGKTYLDVSHNYKSRNAAVSAGKKHNQLAIFDVKRGKSIDTTGE